VVFKGIKIAVKIVAAPLATLNLANGHFPHPGGIAVAAGPLCFDLG
jgi:hypothetical protein